MTNYLQGFVERDGCECQDYDAREYGVRGEWLILNREQR